MSKYKGNYGNSRTNAAAASASASPASSASDSSTAIDLSSLVDLLDSYGFDLPAMLLLFWLLLFFLIVGGVNLYLALVRRRQQQQQHKEKLLQKEQQQKIAGGSSEKRLPENEARISASNSSALYSSSQPKRQEEDKEARRWIENVIDWLYRAGEVSHLADSWLTALNAKSGKLTAEVGNSLPADSLMCLPYYHVFHSFQHFSVHCRMAFTWSLFACTEKNHRQFDSPT